MDRFTASNGMRIRLRDTGNEVVIEGGFATLHLSKDRTDALREFFRAEEDERLGRWRWPDDDGWTVYRMKDGNVRVRGDGAGGELYTHRGDRWMMTSQTAPARAARAYFDAHPEPKPAWHEAKVHEVWVVQHGRDEGYYPYKVEREGVTRFVYVDGETWFPTNDPDIFDARRIYPEEGS